MKKARACSEAGQSRISLVFLHERSAVSFADPLHVQGIGMFYGLKDKAQRLLFERAISGILDTPPVELHDGSGLQVLTQLQSKDVLMYFAAIKSFAVQAPVERVFVLDDGSLTKADRRLLGRHIPGLQLLELHNYRMEGLPTGGTWERLIAIAKFSEERYVVQLDADTLTVGPVHEVIDAVRASKAFTLGTWDGQELERMPDWAVKAKEAVNHGRSHVQQLAEASFDRLSGVETLFYVRGCSGFAGFPPGPGKLDLMRRVSAQMDALLGSAWRQWGSEQVMSNIVVANLKAPRVLPHPSYCDCTKMRFPETRFVHFIGHCRFRGGHYANMVGRLELARHELR